MRISIAVAVFMSAASLAEAIPPYQRLYKVKYGYKPSCTACHDRDNHWHLNRYGRDFYKEGRDLAALAAIEERDPDGDGASSGDEIRAKSNPGHRASKPGKPGKWLNNLPPLYVPKKTLKRFFPGSDAYKGIEAVVGKDRRGDIADEIDRPLRDEEVYPVFFSAKSGKKLMGFAIYGSSTYKEPCFFLAGYKHTEGELALSGLKMMHCHFKPLNQPGFLNQFKGLAVTDLDGIESPTEALEPQVQGIVSGLRAGGMILEDFLP